MFQPILDIIKEFSQWDSKTRTVFLIAALSVGICVIFTHNYISLKEENKVLKVDHQEQIKEIHKNYNTLLIEQRKEFQIEINMYIYSYNKEKQSIREEMNIELETNIKELNRLRKEIIMLKNEISK